MGARARTAGDGAVVTAIAYGAMSDERAAITAPRTERWARAALIAHWVLIAFSTVALTTILFSPPAWLGVEPNVTIARWGFRLSGPSYVILGMLAALLHAIGRLGSGRALALLVVASVVSLAAELIGTGTGYPFGTYAYTPLLGWRVGGRVPFPIPISWFYMLYASLAICGLLLRADDSVRGRLRWALAGGAILTAWDVGMDPAMVVTNHWQWQQPTGNGAWGFLATPVFHGMPLSNWLGWLVTGSAISLLLVLIVPPSRWASRVSGTSLPRWLYAANGVMPVAICARHGLWDAAVLGAVVMALPLVLAWRRESR